MANNKFSYHEQNNILNIEKMHELEQLLPGFCKTYFTGRSSNFSSRTSVGYAYDLHVFFYYVVTKVFPEEHLSIENLDVSILDRITKFDLELYMDYLSYYKGCDGSQHTNDARGKSRKMSAVKGLYQYCYESDLIQTNPASAIHMPKIREKEIIHLDPNEVAMLLDIVENGDDKASKQEQKFHDITRLRDLALLTLMLGTGIRVSECVGLDLDDIDFDNGGIHITRKGGNEAVVYFGEEVENALYDYLEAREQIPAAEGHENALFLSLQKKRITVRAVEYIVKKYASKVTSLKKITPHKLRSTYGTALYGESSDIYLVASVLGHKDINVTQRHYANQSEHSKRKAGSMVKLREN